MVTSRDVTLFRLHFYESRDTEGLPAGDAGEDSSCLEESAERDGADADGYWQDALDGGCDS